eukprot:Platyproteum_vivax@DN1834_c0_g1_i1.p1
MSSPAKQLEGGAKKVSGSSRFFRAMMYGPGFWHSVMLGAVLGVTIYSFQWVLVPLKLCFLGTRLVVEDSREQYQEKQDRFRQLINIKEQAKMINDLAREYNPVATAGVGKIVENKYKL